MKNRKGFRGGVTKCDPWRNIALIDPFGRSFVVFVVFWRFPLFTCICVNISHVMFTLLLSWKNSAFGYVSLRIDLCLLGLRTKT